MSALNCEPEYDVAVMAGQMEVCEIDIDKWDLYNLAKRNSWTKLSSTEIVNRGIQCIVGPRDLSPAGQDALEKAIKNVLLRLLSKWVQCGRREDRFRSRHEQWMNVRHSVKVDFCPLKQLFNHFENRLNP